MNVLGKEQFSMTALFLFKLIIKASSFIKDVLNAFFGSRIFFYCRCMVWFYPCVYYQWSITTPMLIFSKGIDAINIV